MLQPTPIFQDRMSRIFFRFLHNQFQKYFSTDSHILNQHQHNTKRFLNSLHLVPNFKRNKFLSLNITQRSMQKIYGLDTDPGIHEGNVRAMETNCIHFLCTCFEFCYVFDLHQQVLDGVAQCIDVFLLFQLLLVFWRLVWFSQVGVYCVEFCLVFLSLFAILHIFYHRAHSKVIHTRAIFGGTFFQQNNLITGQLQQKSIKYLIDHHPILTLVQEQYLTHENILAVSHALDYFVIFFNSVVD